MQSEETIRELTQDDIPKKGTVRAKFKEDVKQPEGLYKISYSRAGRYLLLPVKGRAEKGFWVNAKDFISVEKIKTEDKELPE